MKKKGFTLIELLAVVLILAIIALILIPIVNKIVESARDAANKRSVEGYIGDVNYALAEKTLVERTADGYDGDEVTDLSGLDYNDVLVCEFYTIKDGVVQYAEECTRKDGAWESFYNYGIGLGVWRSKVLGKKADIDSISIADVAATKDGDTFRVTVSGVRKPNISISSEEPITYVIKKNNIIVSNDILTLKNGENTFEITAKSENGKKTKTYTLIVTASNVPTTIEGESLLKILNDEDLDTGTYTFTVNGQNYPVHMYVYSGNQNWTDSTIPMKNGFGDQYDVATSASTNATRMVIVKVNGDLTNSSTIKPYSTTFGGPKGFMLYVTGKLTNSGTIDNSRGAKAPGQNVYLWKNSDDSYVYIPASGSGGGASVRTNFKTLHINGNAGTNGSGRGTGGGGSGVALCSGGSSCDVTSGTGSAGTSYSGGTGGSGAYVSTNGANGGTNGGAGGKATGAVAGSGAGNPGGNSTIKGENGTGGLLIIYANEYSNTGTISAKGANALSSTNSESAVGGASGGGSINIFTNQSTGINRLGVITNNLYNSMKGTTNVNGGTATAYSDRYPGGKGGNGTVNIGEIRNGTYYDLKTIIEQDKTAYQESVTIAGDSILSIISDNDLATGYHYLVANNTPYSSHLYTLEGNQTITANRTFGDANDVGTSSTNAPNMVIVKVKGDLTINSGVTVSPYSNSYGGPKGFLIYVTGKLTNNGIIDNSHGAKAVGQNVYIWKNADGSYVYVPATGGAGGTKVKTNNGYSAHINGNAGTDGTGRATGGGGSGVGLCPGGSSCDVTSGAGTAGTSYSGGTGGSGAYSTTNGVDGGANGGAGGKATGAVAGSGAGNPGGNSTIKGENGTGGLIIIYANEYNNKGTIQAKGANALSSTNSESAVGGASGGGSINVFTTNIISKGTTNVNGGTATAYANRYPGGAGGKGTVNVGRIVNGSYVAN